MRADLDHLPAVQQGELARIVQTLKTEFEQALAGGTQPFRRNGKILKIILFGSYARSDWVDEPQNGYQSDFDLLVIVNNDKLTDIADYWWVAEDKILHDPQVGRTVNLIVHTLQEVNDALAKGQYFFTDIARDGITLYDVPGHPLAAPRPLDTIEARAMAQAFFDQWSGAVGRALETATDQMEKSKSDPAWLKEAAFSLHQAVERSYVCFLLVHTSYFPRSHNIKFLRSLAEQAEPRLIAAWPRETKLDRRRFELLKRAYVEARYSANYEISPEDLDALAQAATRLRDLVDQVCRERLGQLSAEAQG